MNESKIFRVGTPADFYAKTYQEYLEACADDYSKVFYLLEYAMNIEDHLDQPEEQTYFIIETYLSSIMHYLGIPTSAKIMVNGGYVNLRAYAVSLAQASLTESADLGAELPIKPKDGLGEDLDVDNISFGESLDQLKATYFDIRVLAAGVAASVESNIDAKVAAFENYVKEYVGDLVTDFNNTMSYIRKTLRSATDSIDFLKNINDSCVGDTDDPNTASTLADADVTKYTGSNPLYAADFSAANKAASSVFKAGCVIVGGVLKSIYALGKSIFKKAKKLLNDTLVDPDVFEVLSDGDGYGTVNGFQCQYNQTVWFPVNVAKLDRASAITTFLNRFKDKWVHVRTIGGDNIFRIRDAYFVDSSEDKCTYLQCLGDFTFKPYMVNPDAVKDILNLTGSNRGTIKGSLWPNLYYGVASHSETVANALASFVMSEKKYLDKSADNDQYCNGYLAGLLVNYLICLTGSFEYAAKVFNHLYDSNPQYLYLCSDEAGVADDFLDQPLLTQFGYTNLGAEPSFGPNNRGVLECHGYSSNSVEAYRWAYGGYAVAHKLSMFGALCSALFWQAYERASRPLEWSFLPYSLVDMSIPNPDFSLKTDDQINAAVGTIIATAIIAAAVITVGATALATVKKLKRKKYFQRKQTIGELDNKMWNGEALTKAEKKKYWRAQKRLENMAAVDLTDFSSSGDSAGDDNLMYYESLYSIITGDTPA